MQHTTPFPRKRGGVFHYSGNRTTERVLCYVCPSNSLLHLLRKVLGGEVKEHDEGAALALVLIFVTIFSVWIGAAFQMISASTNELYRWQVQMQKENARARAVAMALSLITKPGTPDCSQLTLPAGVSCQTVYYTDPKATPTPTPTASVLVTPTPSATPSVAPTGNNNQNSCTNPGVHQNCATPTPTPSGTPTASPSPSWTYPVPSPSTTPNPQASPTYFKCILVGPQNTQVKVNHFPFIRKIILTIQGRLLLTSDPVMVETLEVTGGCGTIPAGGIRRLN